jgi:putative oxidoreductase
MATIMTNDTSPARSLLSTRGDIDAQSSIRFLVPIGRVLFSILFILSGISHFSSQTIGYAANQGVPIASILVPLSGAMAVIGGLMVALGFRTRIGALLLILFLIPVTVMMHNFWAVSDPGMAQMQKVHFLKNLAMLGGAFFLFYFGSGPIAMDRVSRHQNPTL